MMREQEPKKVDEARKLKAVPSTTETDIPTTPQAEVLHLYILCMLVYLLVF